MNNLLIFNNYFVKNFYSSFKNQTVELNSILQIIQKVKVIDTKRNNNLSFKESFINSKNLLIFQNKLNYLKKKVSLFLFSLFNKIYHNIGNIKQINNNIYLNFTLSIFKINVNIKVLLLTQNTKIKPANNKFCNAEECLFSNNLDLSNGIILIYDYNFYKDYLTLYNDKYKEDVDDNLNKSNNENNDKNIQSILEKLE